MYSLFGWLYAQWKALLLKRKGKIDIEKQLAVDVMHIQILL